MKPDTPFAHWQQIRAGLIHTIDKFHEGELNYRPFPEALSVAEIILHITNAEDGWLRPGELLFACAGSSGTSWNMRFIIEVNSP